MNLVNAMFIFVVIFVMCILWIVGFLYNMFSPVMSGTIADVEQFINDTENTTGVSSDSGRTMLSNIRSEWMYVIIIFILGMLFWVLVASQRNEPMYYGG